MIMDPNLNRLWNRRIEILFVQDVPGSGASRRKRGRPRKRDQIRNGIFLAYNTYRGICCTEYYVKGGDEKKSCRGFSLNEGIRGKMLKGEGKGGKKN